MPELMQAVKETGIMLGIGLTLSGLLGGAIGTALYLWRNERLLNSPTLYLIVGGLVRVVRSLPEEVRRVQLSGGVGEVRERPSRRSLAVTG
jgi:D-methionine transport system permease protein